mmetsp:Transcript_23657/g.65665  ORF Transcript_23657/g.65665 Transcript_23657/m.65665 type:complete len:442 (+) Transcript_23657:238-1563(+)
MAWPNLFVYTDIQRDKESRWSYASAPNQHERMSKNQRSPGNLRFLCVIVFAQKIQFGFDFLPLVGGAHSYTQSNHEQSSQTDSKPDGQRRGRTLVAVQEGGFLGIKIPARCEVKLTVWGIQREHIIHNLLKACQFLFNNRRLVDGVNDGLAYVDVVQWSLSGIEKQHDVLDVLGMEDLDLTLVFIVVLNGSNVFVGKDTGSPNDIQSFVKEGGFCVLRAIVSDNFQGLNGRDDAPVITVCGKDNLCVDLCVIDGFSLTGGEYIWSRPRDLRDSSTDNVFCFPSLVTGVVCNRVSGIAIHKCGGRQHAKRANVGELLKEWGVLCMCANNECVVIIALPLIDVKGDTIPAVPIGCCQLSSKNVIKVKLCSLTIPLGSIVKLDTFSKREDVLLTRFVLVVCDGPRRGKSGQDLTTFPIGHQSFVHPVVGEKFVGAIRVWIKTTN